MSYHHHYHLLHAAGASNPTMLVNLFILMKTFSLGASLGLKLKGLYTYSAEPLYSNAAPWSQLCCIMLMGARGAPSIYLGGVVRVYIPDRVGFDDPGHGYRPSFPPNFR
jgi:hypothetical protein